MINILDTKFFQVNTVHISALVFVFVCSKKLHCKKIQNPVALIFLLNQMSFMSQKNLIISKFS